MNTPVILLASLEESPNLPVMYKTSVEYKTLKLRVETTCMEKIAEVPLGKNLKFV